MIRSEKGQVCIAGNGISVLADFTCIVNGLKTTLAENGVSKDGVKDVLQTAFDLAFEAEKPNEGEEEAKAPTSMLDDVEKLLGDILDVLKERGLK